MSGLVGVIAQETGRYSMFASSLSEMRLPSGWEVKWRFGWNIGHSQDALVQEMIHRDKDWFWLMGDDHVFSPDLLEKLLAHDLDIVVPLCLMRNPPYRPVIWASPDSEDDMNRVDLDDHPDGGLIEVCLAGGAGMLVKRHVFEALGEPWFEAGRGHTAKVGEDYNFCDKARAAGFKVHCDLDSLLGHCSTTVVWPVREPDGWTYGFSMVGGFQITMPPKVGWKLAEESA